jgi:putative ABC transport system permease protein
MTATIDARAVPEVVRTDARAARARWRFAARLARREVRRRPGRTLLVMLLVAVPVFGMTVVTVLVRTNSDSVAETWARQYGTADLVALSGPPVNAAAFPTGTRILRGTTTSDIGLETADGTARLAGITDLPLGDPMIAGTVLLRSGRFPSAPGEALLSPGLAAAFHLHVGSTVRFVSPRWAERIVGVGVSATNWHDGLLAVRGNELTAAAATHSPVQHVTIATTLIDLPGRPSDRTLLHYRGIALSRAEPRARTNDRAVNWTLVGGMIALAIVGIVISGAFAVGARRQLVMLGQLSANGADESLLRRALSMQGLWSGALGSLTGFGAGVAVLVLMRPTFVGWIHHDPGPYVWSTRDIAVLLVVGVVAATVAAFVPARSAARVPVLSALAGRRPLGELPRRMVPIGAALFGSGVFVLVLVAGARGSRGDGMAYSAVFGGLLVLAGACCVSSVVVAALVYVTPLTRGSGRIAVRSLMRSRARSAAVVMALAAINAGAFAAATAFDSRTHTTFSAPYMPNDALVVSNGDAIAAQTDANPFRPIPADLERSLRAVLPQAQWSDRRVVLGPGTPTVADAAALRLVGLSRRDAATLRRVGAITLDRPIEADGAAAPAVGAIGIGVVHPHFITAGVVKDSVRASGGVGGALITVAKARELGVAIVNAGVIVQNPKPLDESQLASIDALNLSQFLQNGGSATPPVNIAWAGPAGRRVSENTIRQIVLAVVVLIALIVLAMSLALSAAETRDERDVLVSLGARPATMRGLSAWKAGVLALTGALVAVPTGFVPVAVVAKAVSHPGRSTHVAFPWSTALQLVVAAPLLAALVAFVGSAVAQAVRPTRMSTFAD